MNRLEHLLVTGLLGLLSACASTQSELTDSGASSIRETSDLAEVADDALDLASRLGADKVLVVFDIDNTLLAMTQDLGSDQWYESQKDLQAEDRCHPGLVHNRLAAQGALYFASAMRPTQPDASVQVDRVQQAGVRTIALTSRGPDFSLQTFRELRRAGISFYPTALEPARGWAEDFVPAGGSRDSRYEDGVFLTAGQHKGDMLAALLDKTATPYPAVVVMADDKAKNLDAVVERFEGTGTVIHGWRYNREDAVVNRFDADAAMVQWRKVRPALLQLLEEFGAVHYDVSAETRPEGCPPR